MANNDHHCPYCGKDNVSAVHVLDCQPHNVDL